MGSKQQPTSLDSELDERMRKRKLSNRESARKSRMRKQQRLEELTVQISRFQEENKKLRQMIDGASQMYINFESDNNVVRAQIMELTDRLHSLNSMIQIASEVNEMAFDIPDIPDTLLESWRLPCPTQPIPASADMFEY
ncbi:hypothetical protein OROGR_019226 [Orobanche gracilis]